MPNNKKNQKKVQKKTPAKKSTTQKKTPTYSTRSKPPSITELEAIKRDIIRRRREPLFENFDPADFKGKLANEVKRLHDLNKNTGAERSNYHQIPDEFILAFDPIREARRKYAMLRATNPVFRGIRKGAGFIGDVAGDIGSSIKNNQIERIKRQAEEARRDLDAEARMQYQLRRR